MADEPGTGPDPGGPELVVRRKPGRPRKYFGPYRSDRPEGVHIETPTEAEARRRRLKMGWRTKTAVKQLPEVMERMMPAGVKTPGPWMKEQVAAGLFAVGLPLKTIADRLGINIHEVRSAIYSKENQEFIEAVRVKAREEIVHRALSLQRKYFDGLDEMPVDRTHAASHRHLVEAIVRLDERAGHAAGEADVRTENKVLAITMEEKSALLEQLRAARALHAEREAYGRERAPD